MYTRQELQQILDDLDEIEMQGQCERAWRGLDRASDVIKELLETLPQ